jgi:uncharacterized membrane-anchored protein
MVYILYWEGLVMRERTGLLFDEGDVYGTFWQYRNNPAEHERQQPHKQPNHNTDDTWIILLGILFTIGFLALLATTTLWNVF